MTNSNQQSGFSNFTPYAPQAAAPAGGVSPQGFDFGGLLRDVANQAVQALPGIIMGLLSSHPTLGPQLRTQGVNPQFSLGFQGGGGISLSDASPGVSPQGFDFGGLLKDVAGTAIKALPGLLFGLLSAHPVLGPQLKAQGVSPQSLINFGIQTPFGGGGISLFDSAPKMGVSPQGFDFGELLKDVAGTAIKALPGLLIGLLSSHPVLGPQLKAQGVSPQSLFNIGVQTPFGGGGISLFDAAPGVSPQGFDFGKLLRDVTDEATRALPNILNGIVQQLLPQGAGAPSFH